ncbi:hypothetical protein COB21_05795 [Candidatus Aerophobetes bacterium]|uniref:Methyltransferase n=1 Tax=Aerophobetes bacterium TaxID=2030807 RepID=A0A2A4WYB4_UNCAE|nr:MAG: hypothetical protein COB21_05795 [Candidatus Aerophobetes bacterium]
MKRLKLFLTIALLALNGVFAGYDADHLIAHVKCAIEVAEKNSSKLNGNPGTLAIPGMTGLKYRHFLNNLTSLSGVNYLEVGCWKGSTTIAALYGNSSTINQAIAIDNFSEFQNEDIRTALFANIDHFAKECNLNFYDEDAFSIDKTKVFKEPIDIYFYDGNHSFESQRKAFTYFNDIFSDVFIAVVDDYTWDDVRGGTMKAFHELGYEILYMRELGNYQENGLHSNGQTWWNGVLVAVVKKPSK